jgi:methionine-rich copper-binding protein CopC
MPVPRCLTAAATSALLAAASLLLVTAGPASAHARLVRVVPGDGATVTTAPSRVRLVFDEEIRSPADVVVTGPSGAVGRGEPRVVGGTITVDVDATEAGEYTVAFRVVSVDGHPIARTTSFRLDPGGTPTPGRAIADDEESDGGAGFSHTRVVGIGVGLALLAGLALLTVRRLPGGLSDPRKEGR